MLKENKKANFVLDIAIKETIDYHNNRQLKSTDYKPSKIKDIPLMKI